MRRGVNSRQFTTSTLAIRDIKEKGYGVKPTLLTKPENYYEKEKIPTRKMDTDRPKKPGGRVISRAVM